MHLKKLRGKADKRLTGSEQVAMQQYSLIVSKICQKPCYGLYAKDFIRRYQVWGQEITRVWALGLIGGLKGFGVQGFRLSSPRFWVLGFAFGNCVEVAVAGRLWFPYAGSCAFQNQVSPQPKPCTLDPNNLIATRVSTNMLPQGF